MLTDENDIKSAIYCGSPLLHHIELKGKGKVQSAKRKHKKFMNRPIVYFSKRSTWDLRPHLYMVSVSRDNPPPKLTCVTCNLFLCKTQPTMHKRIASPPRGARQLGWATCLALVGRVTLACGKTCLHINTLALLSRGQFLAWRVSRNA